ncbi:ATPase P [Hominifimenecus sp. rT4P-3]|uniref:ATPase P n=1 Tax=Hominifimenecus sp. rT4P-3 TaxID=3242979 RepID=UPI003DA62339
MIFLPKKLSSAALPEGELAEDKKHCRKFGPCGVGKKAVYLNSFYVDRRYYIPLASVNRIYKRIAMSKGGFTGKGIFATLPYLVVEYDNGKEKQCNFKHEEQVDQLLNYLHTARPEIKLHSREAEKRLLEKEQKEKSKRKEPISAMAQANIQVLKQGESYLNKNMALATELSACAKRQRAYEKSKPSYKWGALAITLLGIAAFIYGIYALLTKAGFGVYFLLFGLAAIFLFSSASMLPTAQNNKRHLDARMNRAIKAMEAYIKEYPEFPVPVFYSHPVVLKRMEDILAEGRADTIADALKLLKQDLKALNSSVVVEQEEYEEIVAIKPLFLVRNYE